MFQGASAEIIQSGIYSACRFYIKLYAKQRKLSRFFSSGLSVCVCVSPGEYVFCFFVDVGCPGDHFGDHFGVLEHPEAPRITPWIPRWLLGAIWVIFCTFRRRKASPLLSTFFDLRVLFFCIFCSTEKGSQKDS